MLMRVLECVIYVLAVYGLMVLVSGIAASIRCRIKGHRPMVRVVLFVRDAEEQIEYIVRNAVRKEFAASVFSDRKLAVVDMDSEDETYLLLQKLQKSFPGIEVFRSGQIDKVLDDYGHRPDMLSGH